MLIVGLTGGIATGKSTASKILLEKHRLCIVDADLIAKEVVNPGTRAYHQIVRTFSDVPDLVTADGSLNRPILGQAVFGNKPRLAQLNAIVHPAVKREILWQVLRAYVTWHDVVVLDVPLLFELGLNVVCGTIITTSCDEKTQITRLLARNPELLADDAAKRVASQMSNEKRNYRADYVLDNSGDLASFQKNVDDVVARVRPGRVFTLINLFPPLAVLSALYTLTVRTLRDVFRGREPPLKRD